MYYLRSCYSTKARFFHDSSRQDTIKWYWAETDAPRFLGRSSFAPLTFSQPSIPADNAVGEVPGASRPWRDGSRATSIPSGILDGEEAWFFSGQSAVDPGLNRTAFGVPVDCAPNPNYCGAEGLTRYQWAITVRGSDLPIGVTHELSPGLAYLGIGDPPDPTFEITCATDLPPYDYTGLVVTVRSALGAENYYFIGFLAPFPTLAFSRIVDAPVDSWEILIRDVGGP